MSATARTIPAHFQRALELRGDYPLLRDRDGETGLRQLLDDAAAAAEGLERAGLKRGDKVGFYADNSRRWILTDLAIQLAGGVSVPRGTDTPVDEMVALFDHAGVGIVFAHGARHADALEKARDGCPSMGEIICIDPEDAPARTLDALIADGRDGPLFEERAAAVEPDDLVTIIYTSGTTGRPKGVMLTQSNLGHQAAVCPDAFEFKSDECFLSILPPWHIFERTVEYIALTAGCRLVYTDQRRFREDLARHEPTFVPSVPRIWETVYNAVQKRLTEGSAVRRAIFRVGYAVASVRARAWDRARGHVYRPRRPRGVAWIPELLVRGAAGLVTLLALLPDRLAHRVVFSKLRKVTGGRLRGAISGGGLMPAHVDHFFRNIGVPILVGYGLTETSPVISVRREHRNVLGTIGVTVDEVEVGVRSPETGAFLPAGEVGIICTRGPHVMKGYFKDEELTNQVIDSDGWLDTGDLGLITEDGDICFRGRAKETIVLAGGENIEPSRVEEAILASPLIEQAIVVGQDRKTLAVLLWPDTEAVAKASGSGHVDASEQRRMLRKECIRATSALKPFERVSRVGLLPEALTPENGCLTATLKPRRHVIVERYARLIEEAYA